MRWLASALDAQARLRAFLLNAAELAQSAGKPAHSKVLPQSPRMVKYERR
ncbi:hypothetical protein ANRL2_01148 [Anaerolineae bacterium]|nr:hypothetical protein ANRL2_01148 [Anaerolineae bacterium]